MARSLAWFLLRVATAGALLKTPLPPAERARAPNLGAIAERLEGRANSLRCPFFKRRLLDAAQAARTSSTWLAARHKSLVWSDAPPPTPGGRALPLAEAVATIAADFEARQYYVTGRLTEGVYAADCFFDSPDPDMPVRSPRVFASSLRGLFDARTSRVELLAPVAVATPTTLVAEWRLEGALGLPWRPRVKPFVGRTTFELGPDGRVARHVEDWSLSAPDAFLSALFPRLGRAYGAPPAPPAAALRAARAPDRAALLDRYPPLNRR